MRKLLDETQALIFDLDGTLWDTVRTCTRAWNEAIRREKLEDRRIRPEELRSIMGLMADEVREAVFGDLPVPQGRDLLRECFHQEILHIRKLGARFYPGVLKGIPRLARDRKLYLVSNCDEPYLKSFFGASALRDHFRDWECHGRTGWSKGENLRELIKRNEIASALYVGDTPGDQKAAEFAGIPFVHAAYGFGECPSARWRIAKFSELT